MPPGFRTECSRRSYADRYANQQWLCAGILNKTVLCSTYSEKTASKPAEWAPSSINRETSIIVFGNPGSGKSTILNTLIGETKFAAGPPPNGKAMPYLYQPRRVGKVTYVDTPGLAEEGNRGRNAAELTDILKKHAGPCKMIFVFSPIQGRVSPQDLTTMRQVLLASGTDEILNAGIIINQVGSSLPTNQIIVLCPVISA